MFEVERRGFSLLDGDPQLKDEIRLARNEKVHETVEAFKPVLLNYESLLKFENSSLSTLNLIQRMQKSLNLDLESLNKYDGPIGTFMPIESKRLGKRTTESWQSWWQEEDGLEGPSGVGSVNSLQGLTGPISSEVFDLEIGSTDVVPALLAATENKVLETIASAIGDTNRLLSRDSIFWINFGMTVAILAIAVVTLLVTIYKKP